MSPLEQRALALFQKIGLELNPYCCRPGCGDPATECHHTFSRSNSGTRYEIDNALAVCRSDHDQWCRNNPGEVHLVLKRKIGAKRYERLLQLATNVIKFKEWEMKEIVADLEAQLRKLRRGMPDDNVM